MSTGYQVNHQVAGKHAQQATTTRYIMSAAQPPNTTVMGKSLDQEMKLLRHLRVLIAWLLTGIGITAVIIISCPEPQKHSQASLDEACKHTECSQCKLATNLLSGWHEKKTK